MGSVTVSDFDSTAAEPPSATASNEATRTVATSLADGLASTVTMALPA